MTGRVFARFYEYEGTFPALDSFKRYVKKYGIPYSIYLDRYTTYKSTAKPSIEDELDNKKPLSQVERALGELGVDVIHAHSAPAKGRIERLFRTFQDRLIKEMRLKNIKTIKEANRFLRYYLPLFNRRFSIEPIEREHFFRALPEHIDLDRMLCVKTEHPLRNDFTIAHKKRLYQIADHIGAKKVAVEERVNGQMYVMYKGKCLRYKQITQRPLKEKLEKPTAFKTKKVWRPPMEHPFKKAMFHRRIRQLKACS